MKRQFHSIKQNIEEWDLLRMGRFTASCFKDLFMGKSTAGYEKAIYDPVYERLTGESPEGFYGKWMERGHALEPFAKEQYEIDTFNEIHPAGFWTLGDWLGASPDGLIGKDGLFEGKAPAHNTQMNYLINGELPKIYYWQIHGQMYVTDRNWVDFYAYHPRLKPLVIRVHRDEKIERELADKLNESIEKAESILYQLQRAA